MNVKVSANYAEIQESINISKQETASSLQLELDEIFRNKISTPELVYSVYEKLKQYKYLSGKNYTITIEENSIV